MDWIMVIALVGLGIVLLLVEVIFVPGTTFVGIIGGLLALAGIWTAYSTLGTTNGHLVLAFSVLAGALAVFFGFRGDSWSKYALKDMNSARVNTRTEMLLEGQIGVAQSDLRPSGTALFGEQQVEVHTRGEFLAAGTSVQIVKIVHYKVTVEKTLV